MIDTVKAVPEPANRSLRHNLALGLMLLALHLGLIFDVETGAARSFLLAHFGLFLMWQPLWQGTHRLVWSRAALVFAGGLALASWSTWWLIGLWLAVLLSLIGGNAFGFRDFRGRFAAILAVLYLMAVLLVWTVPHMVAAFDENAWILATVRYGLPVPLLLILMLPDGATSSLPRYAVDLVYSLLLFLLVMAVVLGTLFVRQFTGHPYSLALAQTVLGIAGVLIVLSWLWDPRGGFGGLGQLLSRYVLTAGMPFERWMHSLANLAEQQSDPRDFITAAVDAMLALPWLVGAEWHDGARGGSAGSKTAHVTRFEFHGLDIALHTKWRPGPGLILHMRLLARLLGDYYDAKVREQAQRNTAYLHAIYETGSRVTHDVKNLLQSLRSLCAAVESDRADNPEALRRLIQRQLPQITQRLQATLDKLDARPTAAQEGVAASEWWRALGQRYSHEGVTFRPTFFAGGQSVPGELFDGVVDNLLQNALEKRRRGEASQLLVTLEDDAQDCRLSVIDDGAPLAESLASQLFEAPVASDSGLGVGLYQSARQARRLGYALALAVNRTGEVRFELSRRRTG